jgi:SnoaL-like protein
LFYFCERGSIGVNYGGRNPMQEIIKRYLEAWNETDAGARLALVESLWTADGSYTDPLADVHGPDAIAGLMGAAQQQFPGLEFTLGGPVDANHNQARFTWHLGPASAGAEPVVIGFDVIVLDGDERIRSVHGFLDKVPAAA